MWNISAASRASHSKASEVYGALTRAVPRQIAPEMVSIIRDAGWFHQFKVDFLYPLDAGCIITALDLIFECFCVVLPYSLNRKRVAHRVIPANVIAFPAQRSAQR